MTGYPITVLLLADYPDYRFKADIKYPIDFILSLGDVPYQVLKDIYERYRKPIYAVKGNHDGPMPPFVHNVHLYYGVYAELAHRGSGRLILKDFIKPKKEGPYPSGDLGFIRQRHFIN